jgi:UPF0755 protein
MKKLLVSIFIILPLILSLVFVYSMKEYGKTVNSKSIYFVVEEGSSFDKVSKQLKSKGVIKSETYFLLYAKIYQIDKNIKPGKYVLDSNMKLNTLIEKLQSGESDYSIVTIPEGYTLYQTASRLEKLGLGNKDSFIGTEMETINHNGMITENKDVMYELEGYLFPDTYYIPYSATKDEIIDIMFKRFQSVFSAEYRNRAKEMGLSVSEVVTIASLIEREAANDSERSRIAGVIYNRLKRRMPLQIDATVVYAITKGEKSLGRVYNKDYKFPSIYNTYLNQGLPPGPIASPGKASIEAALYPEDHDYLYYVLGSNGHVFSKTYNEHLINVNKYIK